MNVENSSADGASTPSVADTSTQPTTPAATPAPDRAAEALSAMDAGIAAADGAEPAPKPAAKAETPAEPDPTVVQPADAPVPDGYVRDPQGRFAKKPEAAAPVPGTPEAKTAAEKAAAEAAKAKPAPDAAVESEIAALKLSEKAAERFRGMATEIKALAPIKDLLEKAGVKDVTQLPAMLERSRKADDLIAMVMDTGATPDQYGMTLDYLKLVNRAAAGDRAAAAQCLEMSKKEVAVFAKMLGQEIPGVHDPLAAHADLTKRIEDGDLTRADALEIAQAREAARSVQERNTQTRAQTEMQQAAEQGTRQIADFDAHMLVNDPTYIHKRAILSAMVATIKETVHPSLWMQEIQKAYARIPANASAAPAPVPVPVPNPAPVVPAGNGNAMRPGGPRPTVLVPETATPEQAMDLGIAAAMNG